jgi:hypothetical protein
MRFGADQCKSVRYRPGASSRLRVRQSGQSVFVRCDGRHTGPIGACSQLCERTQPARRRSLNAAARALAQCRQRHRRSPCSIRTLSGVSRWPLPQRSGIATEALLRRRSSLENETTAVLLVGITPPLPLGRVAPDRNTRSSDGPWVVPLPAVRHSHSANTNRTPEWHQNPLRLHGISSASHSRIRCTPKRS